MVTIIIDNYIRVSGLSREVSEIIISDLTYPNPAYIQARKYSSSPKTRFIAPTLVAYTYENHQICVPRGYYLKLLSRLQQFGLKSQIYSKSSKTETVEHDPGIKMRSYQEKLITEAFFYDYVPSVVLQSPPGTGKTFMGLEIIRRRGQKALWICHTGPLLGQAKENAATILNISEDDVGVIGKGEFKIGDFITVALVPTLYRKRDQLLPLRYEFGTCVVDEVHHGPARSWNFSVHQFAPSTTIGLTATAYRSDGLTSMMFDCIGPVVARADKDLLRKEGVLITPTMHQMLTERKYEGIHYTEIVKQITNDPDRNKLLLNLMHYIYQKPNSVTILLSHRVTHTEALRQMAVEAGLEPLRIVGSGMTKAEKALAFEKLKSGHPRLIIATYQLLSEGFDHPPIDHVILATPFRNTVLLEQVIGRSQRISPGKESSVIIDLVDRNFILERQAGERRLHAQGLEIDVTLSRASQLSKLK